MTGRGQKRLFQKKIFLHGRSTVRGSTFGHYYNCFKKIKIKKIKFHSTLLNMSKLTAYACQYSQWILCCFAVFWSSADTKMLISEYATAKATFAGKGKKSDL